MRYILKELESRFGHKPRLSGFFHFAAQIPSFEIDIMREFGRRPKGRNGERLDFTIDHIKSLFLNGQNTKHNWCLLPGKLNHFKNVLEGLQIVQKQPEKKGLLLTIVPKSVKGEHAAVPIIGGGFTPRTKNAGLIQPNDPHR